MKSTLRKRNAKGAALLLGIALVGFLLGALVITVSLILEVYWHDYVKSYSEAYVLDGAVLLNRNNRAGQLNNLTARSRELVYISRQCDNQAIGHYEFLKPITQQLLYLARTNAGKVNEEKHRLVQATLADLSSDKRTIDNGWMVSGAKVQDMQVGFLERQNSGVLASVGNAGLYQHDLKAGLFEPGTDLFVPFTNLTLPDEDADLNFTLSAMPGTATNQLDSKLSTRKFEPLVSIFKDGKPTPELCTEFPSALSVNLTVPFITPIDHKRFALAGSTACTNNTLPDQ